MKRSSLLLCAVLLALVPSVAPAQNFFSDLIHGGRNAEAAPPSSDGAEPAVVETIGDYEILDDGVVTAHLGFDPKFDAPAFYNFVSTEENTLIKFKRTNQGTCYGISIFTLRYFQWFVLPHLLDDAALATLRGKKLHRSLPRYARIVAEQMKLPAWVLAWPDRELDREGRLAKIAPYRLRTYCAGNENLAEGLAEALTKEHSIRMFDNQMILARKGAQIAAWIDMKIRKGTPQFFLMNKYVSDPKLGACEVGFWSHDRGWGHSVVGYRISRHTARKGRKTLEAYKIDLYDSNDPRQSFGDALWFVPDAKLFAPSKRYADLYDDLVAPGEDFVKASHLGPGAEQKLLDFEANLFNRFSLRFEAVSDTEAQGR